MFVINEDKSIYVTRGDTVIFSVAAENENGEKYIFKQGDVLRIKVFEKKACENVVMQKDFAVEEDTESVEIILTGKDTKIGEVISKPTDYWYEVELNPYNNPQTIIGYDDEGAKVFKLYPEGRDTEGDIWEEDEEGEIPNVDSELDATSKRPVQNQAIVKAISDAKQEVATGYKSADASLKADIEGQLKGYVKTDDTVDHVKFTDYATKTKAGVVKVGSESMGVMMNADNTLVIASAGVSEIQAMASANRPITPYYLKHAVKTGLANNDLEWTEEEKGKSRKVIGAIGRTDVVDNLLSDATDLPLSARAGKELNSNKMDKGTTVSTSDGKASIRGDGEGGNLRLYSPDGTYVEMDSHDNSTVRVYSTDANENVNGSLTWNRKETLNISSINQKVNNIGNIAIRGGSKIVTITNGSDAVVLFTLDQIRSLFGHTNTQPYNYTVLVTNGDGVSSNHHLHGTTWLNSNLYVLTKTVASGDISTRINYVVLYSP